MKRGVLFIVLALPLLFASEVVSQERMTDIDTGETREVKWTYQDDDRDKIEWVYQENDQDKIEWVYQENQNDKIEWVYQENDKDRIEWVYQEDDKDMIEWVYKPSPGELNRLPGFESVNILQNSEDGIRAEVTVPTGETLKVFYDPETRQVIQEPFD